MTGYFVSLSFTTKHALCPCLSSVDWVLLSLKFVSSQTAAVVIVQSCRVSHVNQPMNHLVHHFMAITFLREIRHRLWKTHSSVKSHEIPLFSVNFYQFSFIYGDFLRSCSWKQHFALMLIRDVISHHLHVTVCQMCSSFIFIFVF